MNRNTKIIIGVAVTITICIFMAGFAVLGISSLYLTNSSSTSSVQYFQTVSEIMQNDSITNQKIRISGAVIGDSIKFDNASQKLSFQIADIPADYAQVEQQGGFAVILENAVNDPNRPRIQVIYIGDKPELLRNMAQAIVIGELNADGIFYADEILLKCPSRYEETLPDQVID